MITTYYTIDGIDYILRTSGVPQQLITQEYILKQHYAM